MVKKLNSDVQVAEGAFKKAMSDKFEVDEILKEKQGMEIIVRDRQCIGNAERDFQHFETVKFILKNQMFVLGVCEKQQEKLLVLEGQYKLQIQELEKEKSGK